jgi:hypothetical protein
MRPFSIRRPEVERAMWAVAVVVLDEDAEHAVELAPVEDEEPVETLGADGANEALGDRIRLGRPDRCPDDLDAFTAEDGVEVTRELTVAIADQEANGRRSLRQGPGELACLLGYPGRRPAWACSRRGGRAGCQAR